MKNETKQTGSGYLPTTIRVPLLFLDEIKKLSEEIGDSQNGTMLHLMYMGMKVYKGSSKITISPDTHL